MTARALPALTHRPECSGARVESFSAVRPGPLRLQVAPPPGQFVAGAWREAPSRVTTTRCINCGAQVTKESQ